MADRAPPLTFDELALEMRMAELNEFRANEAAELLAAMLPDNPGIRHAMSQKFRLEDAFGQAFTLFKTMAPFEKEIRELIAEKLAAQGRAA